MYREILSARAAKVDGDCWQWRVPSVWVLERWNEEADNDDDDAAVLEPAEDPQRGWIGHGQQSDQVAADTDQQESGSVSGDTAG